MTALLRLELASVLRARVVWVSVAMAASLVAIFLALASRESTILAFTGYTRVVTGVGLAALLFVPGLALSSTVQLFPSARQSGVLEWYLSHPISRDSCFAAMLLPRLLAVLGPSLLAVAGLSLAALAYGEPIPAPVVARLAAVLAGQVICFWAIGALLSVSSPSPEQALARGMGAFLLCAVLLDFGIIGVMLRWRLEPASVLTLSALDPIQAGRLGLLLGADPALGVLGPVGTYVTTTFGPSLTLSYAIGWPLLVAAVALLLARRSFSRRDLG